MKCYGHKGDLTHLSKKHDLSTAKGVELDDSIRTRLRKVKLCGPPAKPGVTLIKLGNTEGE